MKESSGSKRPPLTFSPATTAPLPSCAHLSLPHVSLETIFEAFTSSAWMAPLLIPCVDLTPTPNMVTRQHSSVGQGHTPASSLHCAAARYSCRHSTTRERGRVLVCWTCDRRASTPPLRQHHAYPLKRRDAFPYAHTYVPRLWATAFDLWPSRLARRLATPSNGRLSFATSTRASSAYRRFYAFCGTYSGLLRTCAPPRYRLLPAHSLQTWHRARALRTHTSAPPQPALPTPNLSHARCALPRAAA